MRLGTGALSIGRRSRALQAKAGRYPWQSREQEPPLQAAANWYRHTEPDQWKISTWPPTRLETSEGEGGVGTQVAAPLQIDLRRSASIRKDSLKQELNDLVRSARIRKDLQQEQQLINKGLYKARLVICNHQHNQAIRKHSSMEPLQRKGGAKP